MAGFICRMSTFMSRAYNFSAGPAALPEAVLQQAQQEFLDWQGRGTSVMEISHRSAAFMDVARAAEQDLRDLLNIPDNYKVLFLQGGATGQFSVIPLNLLGAHRSIDVLDTGVWSRKAVEEARKYCAVNVALDASADGYSSIPSPSRWTLDPDAAYVHYCSNETVGGLAFDGVPDTGSVPLVADMSSDILSAPLDVSRFGLIFAGAQKNIGPAGLTLVIVREDLLDRVSAQCPRIFNYRMVADNDSMLNTPPTFSWYLAGLVFKWLKQQGGLEAMAEINNRKASKLYAAIDGSDFYSNRIDPRFRSKMNIPFFLADDALNGRFLEEAEAAGLLYLKGHRIVGGMRASIYNAVPEAAVDALIDFMRAFEQRYG